MSLSGVTYYKLENRYPGDVTKGCGLTGSEIDKNFHFLRGYDIKDAELNAEDGTIVLKRVNDDDIVIDGIENFILDTVDQRGNAMINEDKSYYDKERYELHIFVDYPDGTNEDFVIDGFRIEHDKVYVGRGLYGSGEIDNPVKTNPINDTGFYKSVKSFIDFSGETEDFSLPVAEPGDRYLTREKTTIRGLKYNVGALNDIIEMLETSGSDWRVPTADDWDGLLNAYEDCDFKNHGSSTDSGYYGKVAGSVMKDLNWSDSDPENRQLLSVTPTEHDEIGRDTTSFWSTTTDKINELTTKAFIQNEGRVLQRGLEDEDGTFACVRLVKDIDGGVYHDVEVIDGIPYDCVELLSETDGVQTTKIWTKQNIYRPKYLGKTSGPAAVESEYDTDDNENWHYYINEWDGNEWLKKRLDVNDCLIIESYDGQPDNSEYILTEDGLKNRSEEITEGVIGRIQGQLDALALGIESLSEDLATAELEIDMLDEALSAETEDRINEEQRLNDRIDEETAEREKEDFDYTDGSLYAASGITVSNVNGDKYAHISFDGDFGVFDYYGQRN